MSLKNLFPDCQIDDFDEKSLTRLMDAEPTLMPDGSAKNGLISYLGNVTPKSKLTEDKLYNASSKYEIHLDVKRDVLLATTSEVEYIFQNSFKDEKPASLSLYNDNLVIKYSLNDTCVIYSFKEKTKEIPLNQLSAHLPNAMVFITAEYKSYSLQLPGERKVGVSCKLKELFIVGYYKDKLPLELSPTKRKWLQLTDSGSTSSSGSTTLKKSSKSTKFHE